MNELMEIMLQIQERQFLQKCDPEKDSRLVELRAKVPPQILAHFDRALARGKKAVSKVINGACNGCHMQIPVGTILILKRGSDIQLCGNCGRYLYLEASQPANKPDAGRTKKSPAKSKKKRA